MTTPATQAMQTRVMLVDDHAMCRSGLSELLQNRSGMMVVAATGDKTQVIPLLREKQPELLVLDLSLGPDNGLSVLRSIRTEGIEVPVVVLTMSNSEDDLSAALRAGVRGYLLKDMDPDDVIESIGRAARGELVVAPSMAAKLAQMWQSGPKSTVKRDLVDTLTERERQVLDLVARGMSNKVIAQELDISHNTVKLHVRHIMAKLDLGSRVEAAVFAFEHRASSESSSRFGELESSSGRRPG
ncbi:MAG: response regulator [Hydrogenophaga sp.]|nr:response regulator [Hydrogenophaga sp.]